MNRSSTERILEAVARATDVEPHEIDPPLQRYIDVDALDHLTSHETSSWTLTFELPGHDVTVTSDGLVFVDGGRRVAWS